MLEPIAAQTISDRRWGMFSCTWLGGALVGGRIESLQELPEQLQGSATVTDLILDRSTQLTEGLIMALGLKHRIIAKAMPTHQGITQDALTGTIKTPGPRTQIS